MATLPVQVLFGIYLGILTGIIPALVVWGLGFLFKYVTGVTVPEIGVVVLAVALAGVNGVLLALADPALTQPADVVTVTTAIVVVSILSLYAHSRGDQMGANFPSRLSLDRLRERTLSKDVLGSLTDRDEARVRVVGEVADMEGYPPLPDDLRAELRGSEWTFPADLRLSELETRLAERLETEYDLGDVAVTVDEHGRAAAVAAPPFSGLSKRVPADQRAVSVDAVVPTGLARGDEVTMITADAQVRGTVVSAQTRSPGEAAGPDTGRSAGGSESNGGESAGDADSEADIDQVPQPARAPTTTGGEGRVTVAVTRTDAQPLVRADRARVVVESRGVRREYELVSLLRRAGRSFERVPVDPASPLAGRTLADAYRHGLEDVLVLAVKRSGGWVLAPGETTPVESGDEVFAVGSRTALDALTEVAT